MNPKFWELLYLRVDANIENPSAATARIAVLGLSGMTCRLVTQDEWEGAEDRLEIYMRFVDEELSKAGIPNVYYPKEGFYNFCRSQFHPDNYCWLCGCLSNEPIKIKCSSLGMFWHETYCQHCFNIGKNSIPISCADDCIKCANILRNEKKTHITLLRELTLTNNKRKAFKGIYMSNKRTLDIGTQRFTKVDVMDEPGEGGACHEYCISRVDESDIYPDGEFGRIKFQKGPIKENGVNGCHQEDLIAIVIDRLRSFQAGPFPCRENALAITKMEEALHWLNARTQDRIAHGVEGTNRRRDERKTYRCAVCGKAPLTFAEAIECCKEDKRDSSNATGNKP